MQDSGLFGRRRGRFSDALVRLLAPDLVAGFRSWVSDPGTGNPGWGVTQIDGGRQTTRLALYGGPAPLVNDYFATWPGGEHAIVEQPADESAGSAQATSAQL